MRIDRKKMMLLMANACMNTSDLQKTAGIPRPTLNNAIVGRNVRPATAGKIAKALGVKVEELLID